MTNENRPTRVYKTKEGDHTVTLYTYLTAREKRTIDEVIASHAMLSQDMAKNAAQELPATVLMQMVDKIVQAVVKDIDGAANAFEYLENLPSPVMDEVRTEAQKVYDEATGFSKGATSAAR